MVERQGSHDESPRARILVVAGVAMVVVGAGLLAIAFRDVPPASWVPIGVHSGDTTSLVLTVQRDRSLELAIRGDSRLGPDSVCTLLGATYIVGPRASASITDSALLAEWRVRDGVEPVAGGRTEARSMRDRTYRDRHGVTRSLGVFQGQAGRTYRVDLVTKRAARALALASPELGVRVDPDSIEGDIVGELLAWAGWGLIVVGVVVVLRARSRRTSG